MNFIHLIDRGTPTGNHDAYINPVYISAIIDEGSKDTYRKYRYTLCLSSGYYIHIDEADFEKLHRAISFAAY